MPAAAAPPTIGSSQASFSDRTLRGDDVPHDTGPLGRCTVPLNDSCCGIDDVDGTG